MCSVFSDVVSSCPSVQGNPGTDGIPGAKGSAVSSLSVFMVLVFSTGLRHSDMFMFLP